MSDTNVQDNQTNVQDTTKDNSNTPAKVAASLGKVERLNVKMPDSANAGEAAPQNNNEQNNNGATATSNAKDGGAKEKDAPPAPALTDAQLKEYFKTQGIDYEGVEKLKEKLNPKNTTEETPEQKAEYAKAREKKLVDLFVANGGTVEQYVGIKSLADSDASQLSLAALKKELKEAKFSETEVEAIIKERYYQMDDEEIESETKDETKDFKKRLKEYGTSKLANRSLHTKTQAQNVLKELEGEFEAEDLQRKHELTTSANIDEQFKSMSRKDTFEIGEIDKKPISPVESEVPESELAEIQSLLKDPAKRNKLLLNQDGSLNLTSIGNILAENKKLKAALKASYHEGSTRTNDYWQKLFPARTAHEIGIGGAPDRTTPKGKVSGMGKTQRVNPQQHN